jgi:hypothetical protein
LTNPLDDIFLDLRLANLPLIDLIWRQTGIGGKLKALA